MTAELEACGLLVTHWQRFADDGTEAGKEGEEVVRKEEGAAASEEGMRHERVRGIAPRERMAAAAWADGGDGGDGGAMEVAVGAMEVAGGRKSGTAAAEAAAAAAEEEEERRRPLLRCGRDATSLLSGLARILGARGGGVARSWLSSHPLWLPRGRRSLDVGASAAPAV